MEDKDIKKIIDESKNTEDLELELSVFFNDDIKDINEYDKEKIKMKVYEKIEDENNNKEDKNIISINSKINSKDKRKLNYKKRIGIVASIVIVLAVGTPVAKAIIDKMYSYIPGEGAILNNGSGVYVIDNPIEKEVDGNILKLESLTIDTINNTIYTRVNGNESKPTKEASIKIGGKIINTDNRSLGWGGETWLLGHVFTENFDYDENSLVVYSIKLENGNNVDFEAHLKNAKSVSSYSELGPTNTKENISITAIIKEEENNLDVNFLSLVEGLNADVRYYGKENYIDKFSTGVVLRDVNGKTVNGELIHHGDRANNFNFDISNLTKPYTIEIPQVGINIYGTTYPTTVKVDLPKKGKLDINKDIELKDDNKYLSKNNIVSIVNIVKNQNNIYELKLHFPKNKDSNIKISNIGIRATRSLFNIKRDFSGYGSIIGEYSIVETISIEPDDKNTKTLEFEITPHEYIVEGNWSITIE
ncbi:MAG: hypothetical protein RRZ84_02270 [Romboutsia sp.]